MKLFCLVLGTLCFLAAGSPVCNSPEQILNPVNGVAQLVSFTTAANASETNYDHSECSTQPSSYVWFSYQPPTGCTKVEISLCSTTEFDTVLATWAAPCGEEPVLCNDDGCGSGFSSYILQPVGDVDTFFIQVGGYDASEFGSGELEITCSEPPANDECLNATVLQAVDSQTTTMTPIAFADTSAESSACLSLEDIWYSYTASCDGFITFSTCNMVDFGSTLSIYEASGNSTCVGEELSCEIPDIELCALGSTTYANVTLGTEYLLRIGRREAGTASPGIGGDFTLTCEAGSAPSVPVPEPTSNDECSEAYTVVGEGDFTFYIDGLGSTTIDSCGSKFDVWYAWTSTCPEGTETNVYTCDGTTDDTVVSIFPASDCPALSNEASACNDDLCETQSLITLNTTMGEDYLIAIGVYELVPVLGDFSISCGPAPYTPTPSPTMLMSSSSSSESSSETSAIDESSAGVGVATSMALLFAALCLSQ